LYAALLFSEFTPEVVDRAVELHLDAIHPFFMRMPADISGALDAGLQVNTWTVNSRSRMEQSLDKRVSAIITDEPALLNEVLAARR
jgi:glycerophosphoryl diester phosphodiesterase